MKQSLTIQDKTVITHGMKEFTPKKKKEGSVYDNSFGKTFLIAEELIGEEVKLSVKYLIMFNSHRTLRYKLSGEWFNLEPGLYDIITIKLNGKIDAELIFEKSELQFPSQVITLFQSLKSKCFDKCFKIKGEQNAFIQGLYLNNPIEQDERPLLNIDYLISVSKLYTDAMSYDISVFNEGKYHPVLFSADGIDYVVMPLRY